MSLTRPAGAPGVDQRPFLELAEGFRGVHARLQPSRGPEPSPGDRLAMLGAEAGPLADAARQGLATFVEVLRWTRGALRDLQPWMVQADVLLAFGGLVAAATDGAAEAALGLAALGQALVEPDGRPAEAFARLGGPVELREAYLKIEGKLAVIPPPEDVEAALDALAPLLLEAPPPGTRSLPSLLAQMGVRSLP